MSRSPARFSLIRRTVGRTLGTSGRAGWQLFVYETEENVILRIFCFGIRQLAVTVSPSILLGNRRLRVCTTRHLLHLYPAAPPHGGSHLLDLIEFFPEEEMFPPNESVEILHSDKHDPIFRLIKESLSLPCLRRHFLVAVDRSPSFRPAVTPFFRPMIFDCALNAFL